MPPSYDRVMSNPPSTPPNAVPAYPPASTRLHLQSLLLFVATLGAILTLIFHSRNVTENARDSLPILPDRLAVCYSGHVGTLSNVYQQNIDNIRSFDSDASFFYNLNLHDDYHDEKTSAHYTKTHQLHDLAPVFDYAKPLLVRTYTPSEIDLPKTNDCHNRPSETREHYSHNFLQFFTAAQCYQMIQNKERERGARFGWILHLQPNMNIAVKKPPSDAPPRVHLSGSAMALIPRSMADVFFSAVDVFYGKRCLELDALRDEPCREYSYDDLSTECLLIKWLKRADIVPSNSVYVNRKIIYPADVE